MAYIVCEDCKKRYDFEKDEFCPRCGCFNQPVKTWGTDANGNIVRVDGVNEKYHDSSFVHSEVHHEKDVRRDKGLDWRGSQRKGPGKVDARAPSPQAWRKEQSRGGPFRMLAISLGVIFFVYFVIMFLALFL